MSIDTIITIALAAVLLSSIFLHRFVKRPKISSLHADLSQAPHKSRLVEEGQAEKMKQEIGFPVDSKGLDSDFAATRSLLNAVLSERKE